MAVTPVREQTICAHRGEANPVPVAVQVLRRLASQGSRRWELLPVRGM